MCPRPKKFKMLATRDTLHGSRPNLQQREPDGRIVPTPPDVWDKGANTKRCARRKKKITIIHITQYNGIVLHKVKKCTATAVRSKVSSKLVFASCACDTPIERVTGCVSSLRIQVRDSPWNYRVACTRVNSVILINLCTETIKKKKTF